jgi:hypothetical protein
MSTAKRRSRRAQQHQVAAQAAPSAAPGPVHAPPPVPQYKWKTFPVYFAFWLGALIFLWLGIIAGATGNTTFSTVVQVVVALFLGFGMARLVTTWMREHNWVKPDRAALADQAQDAEVPTSLHTVKEGR